MSGTLHQTGPATQGVAVVPNDSTDLTFNTRALWIGGAGNINIDVADGVNTTTVVIQGIAAGTLLPIACSRVRATSTTATLIVALA